MFEVCRLRRAAAAGGCRSVAAQVPPYRRACPTLDRAGLEVGQTLAEFTTCQS